MLTTIETIVGCICVTFSLSVIAWCWVDAAREAEALAAAELHQDT